MPVNLEIKVPVDSISLLENKLQVLGAEYAGILNQTDIYYRTEKGLLKLRIENGSSQLIHYFRDEVNKDRWSDYKILEINGSGEEFLSGLFETEVTVKKKRKLYWYNNTRVHLDEVENLGSFLELETKVINGGEDARERFAFLISRLRIDEQKQIRKSYRDLLIEREL